MCPPINTGVWDAFMLSSIKSSSYSTAVTITVRAATSVDGRDLQNSNTPTRVYLRTCKDRLAEQTGRILRALANSISKQCETDLANALPTEV